MKKQKKKKHIIFSIRRPIPKPGGPMQSKKDKAKRKRLKGGLLLKKIKKEYSL